MSKPLVSFVVPAFNEEGLIESCLHSIFSEISRTNCHAEVIVVNNNSTDSTRQIASSIPGVIVIDEPKRGLVPARKAGCLAANGKLIANIDADTMLATGWLDIALAEFDKTPRLVALSGPFIHYDLPKRVRLIAAGFYRVALFGSFLFKLVAGTGVMMQGGNFIVLKSALVTSNTFNADFCFYGEDTELARRLGKVGEVKFSFSLRAYSSGRRLAGEGVLRVGSRYLLNYLSTMVFNKPFTETWLDFRTNGESKALAELPPRSVRAEFFKSDPRRASEM